MSEEDGELRPDRPASVELAAAFLIVGGLFGVAQTSLAGTAVGGSTRLPDVVAYLSVALNLLSIVLGISVRGGRGWVATLNVATIYAFLYLSALPNPLALVLGLTNLLVVGVLIARRPWFDAMRAWRLRDAAAAADGRRRASRWVEAGAIAERPDEDEDDDGPGPTDPEPGEGFVKIRFD